MVRETMVDVTGINLPLKPRLFLLLYLEYFKVRWYRLERRAKCVDDCIIISGKELEMVKPSIVGGIDV